VAGRKQFDVDDVLDQAMRVFWEKGFVGTSLEDLTSATGLGRGSLYGTFASKDQLFRRALQRYSLLYGARFDAALARADTDPIGAVEAFFAVVLDRIADPSVPDGCLIAQSTMSSPTLEAATSDRVREMLREQHARVRSALDHTHLDGELLDELATFIVGITQSLAVLSRGGMSAGELQSTARLACETVARRLGEARG
jgi:AcrR family transcriptional regulator